MRVIQEVGHSEKLLPSRGEMSTKCNASGTKRPLILSAAVSFSRKFPYSPQSGIIQVFAGRYAEACEYSKLAFNYHSKIVVFTIHSPVCKGEQVNKINTNTDINVATCDQKRLLPVILSRPDQHRSRKSVRKIFGIGQVCRVASLALRLSRKHSGV